MTAHMGSTRKEKVYCGMYLGTCVWYDMTIGMLSSLAKRSAPKHCSTTSGTLMSGKNAFLATSERNNTGVSSSNSKRTIHLTVSNSKSVAVAKFRTTMLAPGLR